jgi:hypothetical protein
VLSSNRIVDTLIKRLAGENSKRKVLFSKFISTPKEFKEHLLLDYLIGDGWYKFKKNTVKDLYENGEIGTQSFALISQIGYLIRSLMKGTKYWIKYGYRKDKDFYIIDWKRRRNHRQESALEMWKERKFARCVKRSVVDYVYDLEVEDTNVFVNAADGVILHNTDSAFVQLPEECSEDECIEKSLRLQEEINKELENFSIKLGAKNNYMKVDAEKIFGGLLFRGVKKQYFGRLFYKKGHRTNEIFSRGMDIVRRDTPRAIKPIMMEIIESILNKEDMKDVREKIDSKLKELRNLPAWEIGSTKRLSKNIRPLDLDDSKVTIDTYKNNNIQNVKACLFSNNFLGTNWQKADYPKLIAVKMTPGGKDKELVDDFIKKWGLSEIDYVAVDEDTKLPDWITIDYDKMFEKFVYMRLKLFENVEGVNVRRLYSKKMFLEDFFDLEPSTREELDDKRKEAEIQAAKDDGYG